MPPSPAARRPRASTSSSSPPPEGWELRAGLERGSAPAWGRRAARESSADREPRRLGAVRRADLAEDVRDVALRGAQRDRELRRDALIRVSGGDEPEDLRLAHGQSGERAGAARRTGVEMGSDTANRLLREGEGGRLAVSLP